MSCELANALSYFKFPEVPGIRYFQPKLSCYSAVREKQKAGIPPCPLEQHFAHFVRPGSHMFVLVWDLVWKRLARTLTNTYSGGKSTCPGRLFIRELVSVCLEGALLVESDRYCCVENFHLFCGWVLRPFSLRETQSIFRPWLG